MECRKASKCNKWTDVLAKIGTEAPFSYLRTLVGLLTGHYNRMSVTMDKGDHLEALS